MSSIPKSVLTDASILPQLNDHDREGASRIVTLFEPERRVIKNLLRLFFTIAGVSWFLIWFPATFSIDADALMPFKINQYQIYLILLTLWGFELKCQEKRISYILNLSTSLNKQWYHLSQDDFIRDGNTHLLEVLTKKYPENRKYMHLAFTWFLIALTIVQFARQAMLLW